MKLLILNGVFNCPPGRNLHYRGVFRTVPSYCNALPDDHELNQLFLWYLEEGGENGVIHDAQKAIRFVKLCNTYYRERHYEVVQIVEQSEMPLADGMLLGFDLVEGYSNSLLQWGLKTFQSMSILPPPIRTFVELISAHFAPQLNSNGLFQTSEAGAFCLRSMSALQNFYPNLYEGGDLKRFRVIAVYVLPIDAAM